jgi:hypothetical protein
MLAASSILNKPGHLQLTTHQWYQKRVSCASTMDTAHSP